eukprot:597117-Pyramimonas_sp.AAC.1
MAKPHLNIDKTSLRSTPPKVSLIAAPQGMARSHLNLGKTALRSTLPAPLDNGDSFRGVAVS